MVVLHIAHIADNPFSGVAVAVPQHVKAQQQFAKVGLVNLDGRQIDGIENQFFCDKEFSFSALPEPFCTPNLIVFHEVYRPAFLKLYKRARKAGVPYIVIPHGCLTKEAQRKKWLKKVCANLLVFNAFLKNAAAIQFLSQRECCNSDFGKKKIIGPNGVFMPAERKQAFGNETVNIIFIGRMEVAVKGLDLLVRAIGEIADSLRDDKVSFSLCGPDRMNGREYLQGLIDQVGVGDLVELSDAVVGERKEAELLNADIFIQTSRTEGMPMGILEALSYGVPCLVTRGTTLGEIIEEYDAGWVAETNAQSIADVLLKALREKDHWEEKSRNGVKMVEENFLWSKVAENTLREYEEILR